MAKHYTFGWKTIEKVIAKTGGKCFYCEEVLPEDVDVFTDEGSYVRSQRLWVVDHVHPLAKGGTHHIDNLVPACWSCNGHKRTKSAEEFIASRKS